LIPYVGFHNQNPVTYSRWNWICDVR